MPKRYYKRKAMRRYKPKRKAYVKKHKLITGNTGESRPMRLLKAGARYGSIIYSLAKSVQGIRGLVNAEEKFVDRNYSVQAGITGTSISFSQSNFLTDTTQGDTDQTRGGNSILAKTLDLDYTLTKHGAATGTAVQFSVICNKAPRGVATAYSDYMLNPTGITSNRAKDNTSDDITPGNFVTLARRTICFDNNKPVVHGHLRIPLNIHVKYSDGSPAPASDTQNALDILYVSNETTNTPTCVFDARTKFFDN